MTGLGKPLRGTYASLRTLSNFTNDNDNSEDEDEDEEGAMLELTIGEAGALDLFFVGERVSYLSASHNQWLAARVVRLNFDVPGRLRSYDLDVRKRAEPTRIRRSLPEFRGDEAAGLRKIQGFQPTCCQRYSNFTSRLSIRLKRAMGQGDLMRLRRSVSFLAFLVEPLIDALSATLLALNKCWYWTYACIACILAPYLALLFAYRCSCCKPHRTELRMQAFHQSLKCWPNPWSILAIDFYAVFNELRDTAPVSLQNYLTLRHTVSLLESCPWALCQLAIVGLQIFSGATIINSCWLLLSIPQSLFNAYTAYCSMVTLGSITHEGDLKAHVESLIRLNIGAAPTHVLERILEERHVIIDEDLRNLNRRGLRSLARAMGSSKVAESVTFRNTGLDKSIKANADEAESANLWAQWCCDVCDNHGFLETIAFLPAIEIPPQVWQEVRSFNVPVLGQVWNGSEAVFRRAILDNDLHCAVLANDVRALSEALGAAGKDSGLGQVRAASMTACCFDHWQCLRVLLVHTVANVREPMLLSHACENGAVNCVQLMLVANAHPDAKGRAGLTALEMAALKGYSSILRDLLAASASPDLCGNFTPLASAAFSNNEDIARALLKSNADVNFLHRFDVVPLHIAAREGATQVVAMLIWWKADVDAQESKELMTPLHYAAQRGHVGVVRALLRARASVKCSSRRGNTPLHNAAWDGQTEVVHLLLRAHADVTICNGSGSTARDFAVERNHADVTRILAAREPKA